VYAHRAASKISFFRQLTGGMAANLALNLAESEAQQAAIRDAAAAGTRRRS
jgi:hypothetical protein